MILEVSEGIQLQGESEEIAWIIDTTNWTSSPTSPSVVEIIDVSTGRDVKSTVMPSGSASVSGNNITLPILKLLREGRSYHVFVKWTDGSEVKEAIIKVRCPKRNE